MVQPFCTLSLLLILFSAIPLIPGVYGICPDSEFICNSYRTACAANATRATYLVKECIIRHVEDGTTGFLKIWICKKMGQLQSIFIQASLHSVCMFLELTLLSSSILIHKSTLFIYMDNMVLYTILTIFYISLVYDPSECRWRDSKDFHF